MAAGGSDTGRADGGLSGHEGQQIFRSAQHGRQIEVTYGRDVGVRFWVASGSELVGRTVVKQAKFRSGDLETWADLLVAQIPYNMLFETEWLCRELVLWDFDAVRLRCKETRGTWSSRWWRILQPPTWGRLQHAEMTLLRSISNMHMKRED